MRSQPTSKLLLLLFYCLVFFSLTLPVSGQAVDPVKLDSLKRSIERERTAIRQEQEKILEKQDSVLQASKNKIIENPKEETEVHGEKVENEWPLLIPLVSIGVAGVLLLILLKRKKSASLPRE